LYYDKIGLLSPESRGANNYRYYSSGQLALINVIRTLQELGMTLDECRLIELLPVWMSCFRDKSIHIDAKIDNWVRARKLLFTLEKSIHSVLNANEEEITVREREWTG